MELIGVESEEDSACTAPYRAGILKICGCLNLPAFLGFWNTVGVTSGVGWPITSVVAMHDQSGDVHSFLRLLPAQFVTFDPNGLKEKLTSVYGAKILEGIWSSNQERK